MEVRYHGHSCVELKGEKGSIIIDPFINGNSHAKVKVEEIKVDYIYITHGHGDHIGDAVQIAKLNDATIIAPFELATFMSWQGVKVHPLHIGGSYLFDIGRIKATQAFHGSGFVDEDSKSITYLGMPSGVVIELDGKRIYHSGDTGLFSDMKLLAREQIDIAFLPIGDNFTMGPEDALLAAEWIRTKLVVPIHFNTFPVIQQNPEQFVQKAKENGIQSRILSFNEWITL